MVLDCDELQLYFKGQASPSTAQSSYRTIFPHKSSGFELKTVAHHSVYTKWITKGDSEKEASGKKCHLPGFGGHWTKEQALRCCVSITLTLALALSGDKRGLEQRNEGQGWRWRGIFCVRLLQKEPGGQNEWLWNELQKTQNDVCLADENWPQTTGRTVSATAFTCKRAQCWRGYSEKVGTCWEI